MDQNDCDWKPNVVKLEAELILDDHVETNNYIAALQSEPTSDFAGSTLTAENLVSTEKINADVGGSFFLKNEPSSNFHQGVTIKTEITEDSAPVEDPFKDVGCWDLPRSASTGDRKENIIFKSEPDFEKENCIIKKEYPQLHSLKVEEKMKVKGTTYSSTDFPADDGAEVNFQINSMKNNTISDYSDTPFIDCNLPIAQCFTQFNATCGTQNLSTSSAQPKSEYIQIPSVDNFVNCQDEVAICADSCIDKTHGNDIKHFQTPTSTSFTAPTNVENSSCKQYSETKECLQEYKPVESNEKNFSCNQCSAQLKTKKELKKHSLVHVDVRPFSCDQCSARFKRKGDLNHHSKMHSDERPFSCDQCSLKCRRKGDLQKHLLSHSDVKPYSCDQCSYTCKLKGNLKTHLQCHSKEKPFSCDQCSFKGKQVGDLRKHQLSHSDVRSFACDQCSYKSKRRMELQVHLLTHSDVRSFVCNQCSSSFKRKNDLIQHSLTHSEERPFSCNQCSARFKRRDHLGKHLRSHPEDPLLSTE